MNFIENIELKKYKKVIKKEERFNLSSFLKLFNSFMECDRATNETQNTRAEKNKLPNIVCKEDVNETADARDPSKDENHNQIFNNRRIHNIPPNYFRNYFYSYLFILIIHGYK